METAGAALDDRELSQAMKERGLGTPATRAEIIETLLRRGYAERQGKALAATETGIRLVDLVPPPVKSAALTGEWEAQLERIRRKEVRLPEFMERIEAFVRDLVGQTLARGAPVVSSAEGSAVPAYPPEPKEARSLRTPPVPADSSSPDSNRAPRNDKTDCDVAALLRERFRLPSFRPHQEAVCRAVVEGQDVLLVMPTGAGKSLCYQLPGLARGGTTLVVSPLIALMEDQVAKLQALGLRAERIHSGRDRADSRAVGRAYVEGRLDFLFIAPERLRVARLPRDAGPPHPDPGRGRRGALHQRVGARLPARLPAPRRAAARAAAGADRGPHRHRHPARPGRHRGAARASPPRAASSTASAARTSRSRRRR